MRTNAAENRHAAPQRSAVREAKPRVSPTRARVSRWIARKLGALMHPLRATLDRLVRRAAYVVLPISVVACSRVEPVTAPAPMASAPVTMIAAAEPEPVAPLDAGTDAAAPTGPRSHGRFLVTMYYIANEEEVDGPRQVVHARVAPALGHELDNVAGGAVANDDVAKADAASPIADGAQVATADLADINLATAAPLESPVPAELVPAYDRDCKPLAHVSRAFRRQLALQGTGTLRDGRMLNVAARCKCLPCFHVLPAHRTWATGGSGMPLEPFRSVAVDPAKIKLGTLLYLPVLDGMRMPGPEPMGGFIHDGCVVAADTGGNIDGAQLDLFVARRAYVNALARRGGSHRWLRSVEVLDGKGRCQRKGGKVSQSRAGSI